MLSIIYNSQAVGTPDDGTLTALLVSARRRNREQDVTGMLIYAHNAYLQQLEGPDAAVEAIYARVESDPRHRDLQVISRCSVDARQFPGWAMGFQAPHPGELRRALPAFRSTDESALLSPAMIVDPVIAQAVLENLSRSIA